MRSDSDVILIGEIHRTEDEVHQKAESELIRHHEPEFVLHEHLGDYDAENGAEVSDIEEFARRPGETVEDILNQFNLSEDSLSNINRDHSLNEIDVIERYSDTLVGELYRHAKDFRDWERFFEAVTEEEIEESAPFFKVQ